MNGTAEAVFDDVDVDLKTYTQREKKVAHSSSFFKLLVVQEMKKK